MSLLILQTYENERIDPKCQNGLVAKNQSLLVSFGIAIGSNCNPCVIPVPPPSSSSSSSSSRGG